MVILPFILSTAISCEQNTVVDNKITELRLYNL